MLRQLCLVIEAWMGGGETAAGTCFGMVAREIFYDPFVTVETQA